MSFVPRQEWRKSEFRLMGDWYFGESVQSGKMIVDADRLYKLVNLPTPGQHTLRLEFLDENVELCAFTFV